MDYGDRPSETYASDIFIIRFFWKAKEAAYASYLQLTVSRMSYTQLMNDMDRGISGAFYKVVDTRKDVHRVNKYSIRNFVAWEPKNHVDN